MFIELTEFGNGTKRFVNVNHVEIVWEGSSGACAIYLKEGSIHVVESYGQVKDLIKREVAAERGY